MISCLQGDHCKEGVNGQLQYPHFYFASYYLQTSPVPLTRAIPLHSLVFLFFLMYVQRKDRREHGTLFDGIRGHTHHSALTDICSLPSRKATLLECLEPSNTLGSDSVLSGISLSTFRRSEEQNEPSQCSLAFRLHASSGKLWG